MANATQFYSDDAKVPAVVGENRASLPGERAVGVYALSSAGNGLHAESKHPDGFAASLTSLLGKASVGARDPVHSQMVGVYGESDQQGVYGHSPKPDGTGVYGYVSQGFGVRGETDGGVAVQGRAFGGGLAARFQGNVEVTGDITMTNADVAEDFSITEETQGVEPGTVMVLNHEGSLVPSRTEYDRTVAGIVSGAGCYRPAMVLDKRAADHFRVPIALIGKAFCKVDADYGPVEVGSLLTTSPTSGHAMKAGDVHRAVGAMIGKALAPLSSGRGLIPVLVSLQ